MTTRQELNQQKKRAIALLEYPLLQVTIGDGLGKKGIPFLLENREARNVLIVRVVNEYFLEIPVTAETADRVIGLIPYCLHRPDLAHEEIPGTLRVKNYRLARKWDKR